MITVVAALILAPIRVACVGDSITWGVGTHDPASQSYPARLQSLLGSNYEVRNFGHSGATLAKAGDVPYWNVPEFTAAQEFQPQIVVIKLGTNDARSINWPHVKNEFVPDYKALVAEFRSIPSHPRVYVCLPVPDFEERKETIDSAIVPLVKQVARESDAPVIDLYSALEGRADLFPDKLHPNEEGASLIAEAVSEAIGDLADHKRTWRVVSADSQESDEGPAANAIDGDPSTYWHTNYSQNETKPPHEIVVDMGQAVWVSGFRYLPRQDGGVNGRVGKFELYLSLDGRTWGSPALTEEMKNSASWSAFRLPHPIQAKYFKFRALTERFGGPWTSAAELDIRLSPAPGNR